MERLLGWVRASRRNTIIASVAALFVGCVVLAGISQAFGGGNGASPTTLATATISKPRPTTTPIPTATPSGPVIDHVGGTLVTSDGYQCTLMSVTKLAPGEFDTVRPGDTYVVVTVRLVNKTGQEQDYNELDFHVKDSNGNITDTTYAGSYSANRELNYGKLADGGTVTGDLVFEVGKTDHKAMLLWEPGFSSDTSDGWLLGL